MAVTKRTENPSIIPLECRGHYTRRYLREYNDVTGIHGLRYTTEKRSRTEKIVWIILLLASLGGCIYMTYEVLYKYHNSPVVVSLATEDASVYQIPFPAVTFCPEPKYSRRNYNFAKIYQDLVNETNVDPEDLVIFSHLSLLCENGPSLSAVYEAFDRVQGEEVYDTIDTHRMNFDSMAYVCAFADQVFNCDEAFVPILTDAGVCYSFNILDRSEIFREHVSSFKNYHHVKKNSTEFDLEIGYSENAGIETYPRRALSSGADDSFTLFLLYNGSETDYACNSFIQGFRVVVHNPWDLPRPNEHSIRVPVSKVVAVALEPSMVTTSSTVRRFDPSKRKCLMQDERPLKHFRMYTQRNCLFECLANYTLGKCGCVHYYMPRDKSTKICGLGSSNCLEKAKEDLIRKSVESKLKNTESCDCKPGCFDMKYSTEISSDDLYFDEYAKHHQENFQYFMGLDSGLALSIVQIYFKDENFIPKERNELYGISDLVSNLGGLLGLFTGFSLISFVEIIYFCSLRIFCNERMYGHWYGPTE